MTMPRPRPTHLWRMRTRHGAIAWYFCRQRGDKKIRIRGEYGSAEFQAAYEAALTGTPPSIAEASKTKPHSLAWLIEQYRNTTAWADLSPATRRNRENHFKQICKTAGSKPFRAIRQTDIVAGRDRRAATPAQARNFLDAMRGLFGWAKTAQHVEIDPTLSVKNPSHPSRRCSSNPRGQTDWRGGGRGPHWRAIFNRYSAEFIHWHRKAA